MFIEYLDSLPENTKEINVSYKGITSLDVTRFKNLKILNCSNNQLTKLQFNENLEELNCNYNRLTTLHINEKLKMLYCSNNKLTTLPPLKNLKILHCSDNQLTTLPPLENLKILNCLNNYLTILPPLNNLEIINCSLNCLTTLPALENLETLYCSYNQLTTLPPLNEKLQLLHCQFNKLTILPRLNEQLKVWIFYENPIFDIICSYNQLTNSDNRDVINEKLRVLNQFRYLYYSQKFKKRFRDWLWVKIREPKIRERYSHDYLVKNLHEDTDLDDLLENW
jgi:Leucine-rich repeat (LRR) protein